MADWQYKAPEKKAVVNTSQGYYVNQPNSSTRDYIATERKHTGWLEDQDGQRFYLWIHEMTAGFQLNGQTAQSPRYRVFYPRNLIQPKFTVTGQCATQAEAQALAEFIRITQHKSLRWKSASEQANTVKLCVPEGGILNYEHDSYFMYGHIPNAVRQAERWVNSPEYSFEFQVAFAHTGLFSQSDAQDSIYKLSPWMDIFTNKGGVHFQRDPDGYYGVAGYEGGIGKNSKDAGEYTKGPGRPD